MFTRPIAHRAVTVSVLDAERRTGIAAGIAGDLGGGDEHRVGLVSLLSS